MLPSTPFELERVTELYAYLLPVRANVGWRTLRDLCLQRMEIEPAAGRVFLFSNAQHTCVLLFASEGDRQHRLEIDKPWVPPKPEAGECYIQLDKAVLRRLFSDRPDLRVV